MFNLLPFLGVRSCAFDHGQLCLSSRWHPPAHVIRDADVPAWNRYQVIGNDKTDDYTIVSRHIMQWRYNFTANKQCSKEVGGRYPFGFFVTDGLVSSRRPCRYTVRVFRKKRSGHRKAYSGRRLILIFFNPRRAFPQVFLLNNKQRVLMHGHQGWNVRHGLCHIYMIYVYIWVVYSFCLFSCLFIIVKTQFVAL